MTNLRHLITDLRAHAHEVPEDIGALMRQAAIALDTLAPLSDAEPQPAPFPPPKEQADARC